MDAQSYNLSGVTRYFEGRKHEIGAMPVGTTLDDCLIELVEHSGCNPQMLMNAAIVIDDRPIPKSLWSYTRPRAGTSVCILALPGKSIARHFLTIAGVAAAFMIPGGGLGVMVLKAGIPLAAPLAPAQVRRP